MNHRFLWQLTLWGIFLTLLAVLCAPLLVGAQPATELEMFVSPRVQDIRNWGDEHTAWAAIRTPGERDSVDLYISLDLRDELTGVMVTYTINGGGACGYETDESHMRCRGIASGGWIGLTMTFRLTDDKAASAQGRVIPHTVTVCQDNTQVCISREMLFYTPPPDLPIEPQQYLPLLMTKGGENVGTDTR